jgi:hypothetical protein
MTDIPYCNEIWDLTWGCQKRSITRHGESGALQWSDGPVSLLKKNLDKPLHWRDPREAGGAADMMGDAIVAVFNRGRRRDERGGESFIPDRFFESFGPDTAIVSKMVGGHYEVQTWSDLGREKRARQTRNLEDKRDGTVSSVRPMYVWVFHCPGIFGFAYRGWWTYLIWHGGDSGKFLRHSTKMIDALMSLFPMADPCLFGQPPTYEQWQVRFATAFCCRNPDGTARKHAGRIQGKALLWAEFWGEHPCEIIGRAYLPPRIDVDPNRIVQPSADAVRRPTVEIEDKDMSKPIATHCRKCGREFGPTVAKCKKREMCTDCMRVYMLPYRQRHYEKTHKATDRRTRYYRDVDGVDVKALTTDEADFGPPHGFASLGDPYRG